MNRSKLLLLITFLVTTRSLSFGENIEFTEPYLDRWTYPNNATPGSRGMASVFANSSDWTRMGQFVIGFQTSEFIPPEKGAESYSIDSIKLTLITPGEPSFQYDSTYDLFETYTGEDSDEGRPIELHGAGFRNDYIGEDFLSRNTPSFSGGLRTVFPLSWDPEGNDLDVSGNVGLQVESRPWAIGKIAGPEEGAYVNEEMEMIFDVDLSDPNVNQYIQEELNSGSLHFVLSSLHTANHQGGFVNFFTKDSPEEQFFGGYAPRLEINYSLTEEPPLATGEVKINTIQAHDGLITIGWNQFKGSIYTIQTSVNGREWVDVHSQTADSSDDGSISLPMDQKKKLLRVMKKDI